jgi:hypothetical protein
MTAATNYTTNKVLVDYILRQQTATPPANLWYCLFIASKGYAAVSTVYTTGDTVVPVGFTPARVYKATTGGTSAASAPTWPTTNGGTVTDGGVTWTEQTIAMIEGTFPPEASYTGYTRTEIASSLANWSGTLSQGSTAVSSGVGATLSTYNNTQINFPAPTGTQSGIVVGMYLSDASSAGNIWFWSLLTNPKTINSGDAAPNFPQYAFQLTWS